MTSAVPASGRWAVVAVSLVAIAGCSSVQQEADHEAARIADHVLPAAFDSSTTQPPEERAAEVADRLSDPDRSPLAGQRETTWVVRGREGTSIRLDVYTRWESGSFFPPDQGKATWGRACRIYDVGQQLTSTPVECPDGTPEAP